MVPGLGRAGGARGPGPEICGELRRLGAMAGHGERLGRKQEQAIAALLSEPTGEKAAKEVGVSDKTLRNWSREPAFQELFSEARLAIIERTVARVLALQAKAVEALEKNLTCGSPAAENRAAELLLTFGRAGVEQLDLARQLAELNQQITELKRHEHGNPPPRPSPPA